jgi:hypothetical protein
MPSVVQYTACVILYGVSLLHTEFLAVWKVFPNALLRLCTFHIIRATKSTIQPVYGAEVFAKFKVLFFQLTRLHHNETDLETAVVLLKAIYALLGDDGTVVPSEGKYKTVHSMVAAWRGMHTMIVMSYP